MEVTRFDPGTESPSERRKKLRAGKKKHRPLWQKVAVAVLAVILLGVGAGFFWLRSIEGKMRLEPKELAGVTKVVEAATGDTVNVLLVGTDQRAGMSSARADTIMFVRADRKAGKAYMVSIPRDTRVTIPGRGLDKINHSWAFGKTPLLIETVSDFMGLPINYVFQVDFTQFEKAVDALGGVDFATASGWTDGELGVSVRAGSYRRNGKEALAIIRNRSWGAGSSGSDLARVGVQQEFMKAMVAQSMNSYADVPGTANVVASYVNTNMGLTEMLGFGRSFAGTELDIQSATLKVTPQMIGGVSYVVHDEPAKVELIGAMLKNKPLPE